VQVSEAAEAIDLIKVALAKVSEAAETIDLVKVAFAKVIESTRAVNLVKVALDVLHSSRSAIVQLVHVVEQQSSLFGFVLRLLGQR